MSNSITISKANPLLPTEDFWKLREAGIDLISKLGSDFWTDYNTHDPGITILEAVSYAITDLGYRTGFDMKDLLAPSHQSNKAWENIFYTARQILHCNPLTISDYRKIIIDVRGVRNAWIEPSKDYEVPLLVDYQFVSDSSSDCGCCNDNHDKICAGKLTINEKELTTKSTQFDLRIKIMDKKIISIKKQIEVLEKQQKNTASLVQKLTDLEAEKAKIALEKLQLRTPEDLKTSSKILEINGLYNVMIEYEEDVLQENQRDEVRQNVASRLHRHRNLCEDFLSINAVDYDDFNVLGSFVLEENADSDKVLAQIFFTIYKYFVPTVNFYTIEQMIAEKHLQVDEIFEGPALKHGFIDTQELESTDFFRDMRLSDIVNSVMDIEGIKAITYLHIPSESLINELKNSKVYFNDWINSLKENRKVARLDVDNSTMLFCKEREFITYNAKKTTDRRIDRAKKLFNDLKAQERQRKLSGHEIDLPVPMGENMELEDYFPVTYSLPSPYHVKEYDTVEDEKDPNRKIQQLQLKGYLLFFEQILGDYLSQLGHLRELFSFDENVHQTYYTRVLTEINDLKLLILDHTPPPPPSTYKDLLETLFNNKYPKDNLLSRFASTIQNLVEGPKLFGERRNDMLDHLLARFSEDMGEYDKITRLLLPDNQEDRRLIGDKIRVLQDYIKISNYRAKALNYAPPMKEIAGEDIVDESFVWNSENVSGVERRVGRLLGFQDISRRCLTPESIEIRKGEKANTTIIVLRNPENCEEIWLESIEVHDGCCSDELLNELILVAGNRKNYQPHDHVNTQSRSKGKNSNGSFKYTLIDSQGTPIANTPEFCTRQEREDVLKAILHEMACINDNEGMHLVEHILLRPKLDSVLDEQGKSQIVSLLDICLDPCDLGKGIDQNVDKHRFRFSVNRMEAKRCFDKKPWVLGLKMTVLGEPEARNILFNPFGYDDKVVDKTGIAFRFYDSMNQRLRDIREFGSEPDNYKILSDLTGFELFNSDTKQMIGRIQFLIESEVKTLIEGDDNARKSLVLKLIFQKSEAKLSADEKAFLTKFLKDNPKDKIVKPLLSLLCEALIKYLSFQLDLYCQEDPCDHNEDPYSFRTTIILPCWVKRFRDKTFRNLVEKTIQNETPAHIRPNIRWVGIQEMRHFEETYYNWLKECMSTYAPDYEKVNPLVEKLNHITECGHCEDDCEEVKMIEKKT